MEVASLEITPIDQKKSIDQKNIQPQLNSTPTPNLNLNLTQKLDFSSPLTYTYLSNEQ